MIKKLPFRFLVNRHWVKFCRGFSLLSLLTVLFINAAHAQHVLTGVVHDERGEPLPGASVKIKDTTKGIVTDVDGKFLLEIDNPDQLLQISFIGYHTLEVVAGSERNRAFKLAVDEEQMKLEEVAVVGFGTQRKVSVTGAISTVSTRQLEQSAAPSLSNALGGRLPGIITRQSSGEPGYDQAQVFIRGMGTWVNRAPLVLIDGVERDLNQLNAQEIESFSILKDASATAVYGVRGANGVILINTRKGVQGRPKVTFRSETAQLTALRLPNYINATEYAGLMNEGLGNVGQTPRWTNEEIQKFADGSDPYFYPNVDWTEEIMRKTTYQTINNLNVTGGNDIIRYYTNVGYTEQNGIWKNDASNLYNTNANMKRYNFRSNVDINVTNNLIVELGVGGIIQQGNYPGHAAQTLFNALRQTPPLTFPKQNPDGSPGGILAFLGSNPWAMVTQSGYAVQNRNTVQGTFSGKWDLSEVVTKGLSLNARFAYDHYYHGTNNRNKSFEVKQFLGINPETGEERYQVHREATPLGYDVSNNANRAIYYELIANYDRTFGKHSLTGMALYNQRDYINITASSSILNLPYRRQGVSGRLTYGYDDKYLAEFNVGYNGSENFPKGQRFGFFPSVSAGWVASNEKFWNLNVINHLKLRGSYGQAGNDQIGDPNRRYLYLTTVNARDAQSYHFGDGFIHWAGIDELQMGNPNVTWEVATKSNLGVDLELFNSQITLQVDAFRENREGILIQRQQIPFVTGFYPWVVPYGNLGKAKNRGIDGMLEARHTTQKGLFYSFRGNFTYAKNEIIENDEPPFRWQYQSAKGHPIDQPFGLIAEGIFQNQDEIDRNPTQTFASIVRPGDIRYRDVNGDGVIDDFDRVPIGLPRTPQIMYGFGGTIAYKNFDLTLFFQGAARTSIFLDGNTMYPFLDGIGSHNMLREYYDNRWTPETPGARYPAVTDGVNQNNFRTNTTYMFDGSYLRLKNAEFAYTFHEQLVGRLGMNALRLFINGINLYTWDKVKVIDPESNNGTGQYPLQRTLNFGVQVNFK
ncbi:TonB-dependent receptor [Olivibacter sp. SDN3]|uniref:SusC/RagA family TonB-linked outer membrane protein n=1 Tax=Olivibacter sp. SDN3 TaxID=2764720 RepID=UPI001650DD25|nr:TonB-dependent receptor [Olivibacter sp. SDN3]QNL50546.1 TonB-dependent receptor [Olivibacter sp. SDN3]